MDILGLFAELSSKKTDTLMSDPMKSIPKGNHTGAAGTGTGTLAEAVVSASASANGAVIVRNNEGGKRIVRPLMPRDEPARRHRKRRVDNAINSISKKGLRRLARRGGIKRIGADFYDYQRAQLRQFLDAATRAAIMYARHAGRKTVTVRDALGGLRFVGVELYV